MLVRSLLSWLKPRSSTHRVRRRRSHPLSERGLRDWLLEERCVPSSDPVLPGNNGNLTNIFWNGGASFNPNFPVYPNPGGNPPPAAAPPAKLLTITNNNPTLTVYPFLRDANTGTDPNSMPANTPYDPWDPMKQEYRAYIGYVGTDNLQHFGLPPGSSITVRVPLVFWDAENTYFATDPTGMSLPVGSTAPNPYGYDITTQTTANGPYTFVVGQAANPSTYNTAWVTAYTGTAGISTAGLIMFYHASVAKTATPDALAQLTEFTIRDAYMGTANGGWLKDDAQTKELFNYDVSYVNDQLLPIAMEATQVPIPNTIGPIKEDYGWIGSNLDYATVQQDLAAFTSVNLGNLNNNPPFSNANGLGAYFGGFGWPSYINGGPGLGLHIPSGANIFDNSPLTNQRSVYSTFGPNNQWLLTSGNTAPLQATAGGTASTSSKVLNVNFTPQSVPDRVTFFNYLQKMLDVGQGVFVTGNNGVPIGQVDTYFNNPSGQSTVTLKANAINGGNQSFVFFRPATDYAATAITNLWYSWADYYVKTLPTAIPGYFTPGNYVGNLNGNLLTITDPNYDPTNKPLRVGMTVSGNGINPAQGTTVTILKVDGTKISLSQLGSVQNGFAYTFGLPQQMPYESTDPTGIRSITVTSGGTGYTSVPTVTINNGVGGATAYATFDPVKQVVTGVVITNPGTGFSSFPPPTIQFSGGGGGSGAAATAIVGPSVTPFPLKFDQPDLTAAAFAGSVYEAMLIESPATLLAANNLPNTMNVVDNVIKFNANLVNANPNLVGQARDVVKSILRGVPDYLADNNELHWYPDPSVETGGQKFNVYNLDPYVWFVHKKLGLSGYGFSVDDDTADVNSTTSTLTANIGGLKGLNNKFEWFNGVPYGTVYDQATISNDGKTITLTNNTIYNKIAIDADDLSVLGAYVSGAGIDPLTRTHLKGGAAVHIEQTTS